MFNSWYEHGVGKNWFKNLEYSLCITLSLFQLFSMIVFPASLQLDIYVTIYTLAEMIMGPTLLKSFSCNWRLFIHSDVWLKTLDGSVLSCLCCRCKWRRFQNEQLLLQCLYYKRAVSVKLIPWLFLLVYIIYRPIRTITESRQLLFPL